MPTHYTYPLCLPTMPTHYTYPLCLPTMPTHYAYPLYLPTMPTHYTYPLMPTHAYAYPRRRRVVPKAREHLVNNIMEGGLGKARLERPGMGIKGQEGVGKARRG